MVVKHSKVMEKDVAVEHSKAGVMVVLKLVVVEHNMGGVMVVLKVVAAVYRRKY